MLVDTLPCENKFERKLRLCRAKLSGEIDSSWEDIVQELNLNCSGEHLRRVAYGLIEYDNYINGYMYSGKKILSISDLHVPYQLEKEILAKYVNNVDVLQLNGDIVDMQAISKFPKVYRNSPIEEIIEARQYLIDLIEYIKPKSVSINYGNHDIRFQNYFANNLDTDLLELMPQTALELIFVDGFRHYDKKAKTKIWYEPLCNVFSDTEIVYNDSWFCQIGKTIFCHPSAFSTGILKTAEKAMLWFRNEGCNFNSLVMAHTHRSGEYEIGNTTIYEQGAFCRVEDMQYTDGKLVNSQKSGYLYMVQDKNGNVIKDRTKRVVLN